MAALLGAPVDSCAPLGGETGEVLRHLLGSEGVALRAVEVVARAARTCTIVARASANEWWRARLGSLGRHEVDDLYKHDPCRPRSSAVFAC